MPAGRPPTPAKVVAEQQELYLELLALGKTEREIDAVEGMACWRTRAGWKKDAEFNAQLMRTRELAAQNHLLNAEKKLEEVIMRAEDEACSPQLASLVNSMLHHARWKASVTSPRTHGNKVAVGGDEDAPPIQQSITVKIVD